MKKIYELTRKDLLAEYKFILLKRLLASFFGSWLLMLPVLLVAFVYHLSISEVFLNPLVIWVSLIILVLGSISTLIFYDYFDSPTYGVLYHFTSAINSFKLESIQDWIIANDINQDKKEMGTSAADYFKSFNKGNGKRACKDPILNIKDISQYKIIDHAFNEVKESEWVSIKAFWLFINFTFSLLFWVLILCYFNQCNLEDLAGIILDKEYGYERVIILALFCAYLTLNFLITIGDLNDFKDFLVRTRRYMVQIKIRLANNIPHYSVTAELNDKTAYIMQEVLECAKKNSLVDDKKHAQLSEVLEKMEQNLEEHNNDNPAYRKRDGQHEG